ncbi:MAG TPA: GNAT family protein [Candidatus Limnocylindrales bacterium]|nr:GNAT family protein [Candidatus Limnocylindrales bacterium]
MSTSAFGLRDLWPLYDLRVRTGELELRYPTEAELPAFADIIEAGLHPKTEMPFGMAWTDAPTAERNVSSYQWWVGTRGRWAVDSWVLTLGVWERGVPVGFQDVRADRFPVFRTVHTGSWLGMEHQGHGIGKLMRQAVLGLAFDHLGARFAETSAFLDNHASNNVSIAVGYEKNGFGELAPHGVPRPTQNFRMTPEGWRSRPRPTITVEGLEGCAHMFGAGLPPGR